MKNKEYIPPYTITDNIINLIAEICGLIGSISQNHELNTNLKLRRNNQIKTIHASLAIENNSLSIIQVTDIINGKKVLGAPNEICEVKNAYEVYKLFLDLNPYSVQDLLSAHNVLMNNLVKEAGMYRSGGVGVFAGKKLIHMAPPANLIIKQINDLLIFTKNSKVHPLIKSCIFHYEFEFIHPFADGNGRMGRLWQTLLLSKWKPIFAWLPVETLIKEYQDEYYKALSTSDNKGNSSSFIEFMLQVIHDTLYENVQTVQVSDQVTVQVRKLLDVLGDHILSTKDLMKKVGLKHRPTFRKNYLLPALKLRLIKMTIPDKPNSSIQKYKKG